MTQPDAERERTTGLEFNRRYGHADDCKFGLENSGFCSCAKGFNSVEKRITIQRKREQESQ